MVAVCVHVPIGTCVCVHICVRVRARACALRVRVHVRVRVRVHVRVRVLCVHPHVSLASCDSPGPNLSPRTPFAGWDNDILSSRAHLPINSSSRAIATVNQTAINT